MSACVLKLIAAAAMLCDHVAVTLYPLWLGRVGYRLLRGVGRVAFPIYAYFIAVGYEKTSNVRRYLSRLSALALISQIPFVLVFVRSVFVPGAPLSVGLTVHWLLALALIAFVAAVWLLTVRRDASVLLPVLALLAGVTELSVGGVTLLTDELNVFYTLALGLACVSVLDRALKPERDLRTLLLQAAAVVACFLLIRDTADYRYLGAALIICFWAGRDQRLSQLLLLVMWAAIEYLLGGMQKVNFLFACLSALPLYFYNGERGKDLKRFFYWFYPAHLAVLGVLSLLISA